MLFFEDISEVDYLYFPPSMSSWPRAWLNPCWMLVTSPADEDHLLRCQASVQSLPHLTGLFTKYITLVPPAHCSPNESLHGADKAMHIAAEAG